MRTGPTGSSTGSSCVSDAPEVSRAEERERLLAATLAHATAREEAFRQPTDAAGRPSWWKVPLALLILLAAGWITASPPDWLFPAAEPSLSRGQLERGVHAALYLQAREIDAYRLLRGRLPDSLEELPERFDGLRYVRSDSRVYQLVAMLPDGSRLIYDSAHPAPGFSDVSRGWGEGGRP